MKTLTLLLAAFIMFESCQPSKPACGSKRHKKSVNKRVKKNTNFMTY